MTFVLIEKGVDLEGWPSKIEVGWVLGTLYLYQKLYLFHVYII